MHETLSEPVRLLVDAVAAVRAQAAVELPEVQALAETAVVLREIEKLQAISLARLADVHTRELHTLVGAPSAGSWLEQQQVGVGRDRLALAGKLQRIPQVAEQVRDGRLALASALVIGQAVDQVRRHLDRPDGQLDGQPAERVLHAVLVDGVLSLVAQARGGFDDDDPALQQLCDQLVEIAGAPHPEVARVEAAFLVLAQQLEPAHLRPALGQLVDALLPLQLEDRADRAHAGRGLKLTRKPDGSGWTVCQADLDLECGELLATMLTAARATDPANPTDTAGWATHRDAEQADQTEQAGGLVEPTAPAPRAPAKLIRPLHDHG